MRANDKRRVSALVQRNYNWSREEIARAAHKKGSLLVSRWTIGRYLKTTGWLKQVPKLKPMLSQKQKEYRVKWGRTSFNEL